MSELGPLERSKMKTTQVREKSGGERRETRN